jgi:mannosyltransferase
VAHEPVVNVAVQSSRLQAVRPNNLPYDRLAVVLLSLVALGLRLPGSGGDLWIDEVATLENFVKLSLTEIVSTYHSANNHILYSVLARISISLFGETERMLRLPAIVFGAAAVPALYYLARSVTSLREAFAATFLLAVSYHHAYFSQNARGYTGYLFFSVLSTAFLFRALSEDRQRHWAGFVISTVANLYMHLNAVFILAAQVAGTLILYFVPVRGWVKRRLLLQHFFISLGAVVLVAGTLYAPIAASAFTLFTTSTEYREMGWPVSIALLSILLQHVAPGFTGAVAVIVALPVALAGTVSMARTTPLLLYVAFVPPLLSLGVALLSGIGMYPRFFLSLLPFGLLIAVRGLNVVAEWCMHRFGRGAKVALTSNHIFLTLIAISAAAAASGLPRLHTLPKQDYTGALAFVRSQQVSGELVAAAYIADTGARFYDSSVLSARTVEDLESILTRGVAVWLLGSFIADMRMREPRLAALIDANFRELRRFPGIVGDGAVVVWKSVESKECSRSGRDVKGKVSSPLS